MIILMDSCFPFGFGRDYRVCVIKSEVTGEIDRKYFSAVGDNAHNGKANSMTACLSTNSSEQEC
jgi:hypothetical protein